MVTKDFIKSFANGLKINSKGRRIKQKIVVIESDDWGSIRTPNKEAVELSHNFGSQIKNSRYHVDGLATSKDLDRLFDVLSNHRDKNGLRTKLTANTIVANPDYKRIQEYSMLC